MLSIRVEVLAGSVIGEVAVKAIDLAQRLDVAVKFNFNGVECYVLKNMTSAEISNEYIKMLEFREKNPNLADVCYD